MLKLFLGMAVGLLAGLMYAKTVDIDLGNRLADCAEDKLLAELARDQLLSGGHWIRRYDSKTDSSSYHFWCPKCAKPNHERNNPLCQIAR